MSTVMLYGATGYSGRLIVAAAQRLAAQGGLQGVRLLLGGRDGPALSVLAAESGFAPRAFALDDRERAVRGLEGVNVVLNAAGPFAATAPRLARAALAADAHYVDLSGEPDVYRALDDLAPIAQARRLAMVCGAGRIAAVSDVLLDSWLAEMTAAQRSSVATLRIVHSRVQHLSRGSLRTSLQAMREQVTVVRAGLVTAVPVGRLERVVDFDFHGNEPARRRCAVSATSFLDTLAAQRTLARHGVRGCDIDSYMEMGDFQRLAYELGALGAGWWTMPLLQGAAERRLQLLPEGPTPEQRKVNGQRLIIEVENRWREVLLRGMAETPDPYAVSADIALHAALALAQPMSRFGWLTPAQAFGAEGPALLRRLGVWVAQPQLQAVA